MRYAEQSADVTLGHALFLQVLSRSPCLGGGRWAGQIQPWYHMRDSQDE